MGRGATGLVRHRRLAAWPSVGGALVLLLCPATARTQSTPPIVGEVTVEQEGAPVRDAEVLALIDTRAGRALAVREARESIEHLMGLDRYEDVRVFEDRLPGGAVRIRYVLVPRHMIDRLEFRGHAGIPEDRLRQTIEGRYGAVPPESRMADVVDMLRTTYRTAGYPDARVAAEVVEFHDTHRATMLVTVESGPQARIAAIAYERDSPADMGVPPPDLAIGQPYDAAKVDRVLEAYVNTLDAAGYYEARASHTVTYERGVADVRVDLERGPRVTISFAGDPLPADVRERLVPIRREGSADEDLLEDSSRAIENYLRARGYRDARAPYTRTASTDAVTITFTVTRGPRYEVTRVDLTGASVLLPADLAPAVQVHAGEPLVQQRLDATVGTVRALYLQRGFIRAVVDDTVTTVGGGGTDVRRVVVALAIDEGPRVTVGSLAFEGNAVLTDAQLGVLAEIAPGTPFSQGRVLSARDRIETEYRNRGYEAAVVLSSVSLPEAATSAAVAFRIVEGPLMTVDRVIIVGNTRTSADIIRREVLLTPGGPLGYGDRVESQERLAALGLFRRVSLTEVAHLGGAERDVIVRVEEAPPTTVGYGAGLELGSRLGTDAQQQAEERFEVVPRAFFEIGRRNMWGKNRSVNLFTRVALRSRTLAQAGGQPEPDGNTGLNEYRVFGTFREPRVFGTRADFLLTGIIDQAIRSSFNFRTRQVSAETGVRLSRRYSIAGRYSFEHTDLFDERFTPDQQPLIDKVFPQVRLSTVSGSFIRDTRDDAVDPSSGRFAVVDAELAARAIGSEVGYAKTYLQGFSFTRLPSSRRLILALGARVGLAHGFPREVTTTDPDGTPRVEVLRDLPASKRFFAGGDTTVRGFSLDRLGNAATITSAGFPTGGNGVIILNGELRASVTGPLQGVVFLDAGNVFPQAGDLDITDLRASAGFGVRYRSPVGPIRIDLGFKLDRRELAPGRRERGYALHISLGQAF